MAMTNHERVGKALELLRNGLAPFVEREVKTLSDEEARVLVNRLAADDRLVKDKPLAQWDVAALLKLLWDSWNEVFKRTLGFSERSLVSELRDHRNKWAHQETFSGDDAYRVLDSASRLLTAVSAPQADEIEKMKMELLRIRFEEQRRAESRKTSVTAVEGKPMPNLRPWREIVTPHPGSPRLLGSLRHAAPGVPLRMSRVWL